jgi:hypothetical protein
MGRNPGSPWLLPHCWLSVYAWQQPGHAAGVSVLDVGSDHYLPVMSPAEARELAAALVARADDAEAAG